MSRKPSRKREITPTGRRLMELYASDPKAAALEGLNLLLQPVRPPVLPAQAAILNQSTRSTIIIDSVPLRVYTWEPRSTSNPSTILLTHGHAHSTAMLTPLVPLLLAQNHRVVAYDQPASGESPGITLEIRIMVNATRHLIHTLQPSLQGIIGFSVGATAAVIALAEMGTSVSQTHPLTPRPWLVTLNMPTQTSTLYLPFVRSHGLSTDMAVHLNELHTIAADEAAVMIPQHVYTVVPHPDTKARLEGWNVLVVQDQDDWMALPEGARWFIGALGGESEAAEQDNRQVRVLWTSRLGHFGITKDDFVLRSVCEVFRRGRDGGRSKI